MRTHQFVLRTLVLALVAALVLATPTPTQVSSAPIGNSILARAVEIELGLAEPGDKEQLVSSGAVYAALAATGELDRRASAAGKDPSKPFSRHGTQGCSNRFEGGGAGGANVRVNQDCSLRRQAEEMVVVNPLDDDNLIAGQNDSRIGFNHCGYSWSFDGGKTWGDQTPPFWQFVLLDNHTADACSDPSATFDSRGNAYITGIIFDVGSAANAIVVAKSNAPIGGAFYHSPAVQPFQTYRDVPLGVVANDNDPAILHDKEFIVADANSGSPKRDNVYVTWTRFTTTHSPIYFSQSTNGGATWSAGVEIDGVNASICTFPTAGGGACNDNQGSHPIVGPDGTIYVIFGNANTPLPGINQVAMVKCPAAANCASSASWSAPVKINDLIGTHPRQTGGANPITGCPNGRRCLPPNGYRVPEFTSMSLSIDAGGALYAVWADFRNGGPPCNTGSVATSTPPCNNDVFYATSTNGGATWSPAVNVAPASQFGPTAQWQPWSKVTKDGTLWVAYYDRSYGTCEFTGCNDITLARIANAASSSPTLKYTRLTTESMPNLVIANNPIQAGFLGDYMWVEIDSKGRPLVVWADTRGLDGTVEEDIYFARP